MTNYREIAETYLKHNNPAEDRRLKQEGVREELLQELAEEAEEKERQYLWEMKANLPKDLPFMERVGRTNMLRMTATELAIEEMLDVLRPPPNQEEPEERPSFPSGIIR